MTIWIEEVCPTFWGKPLFCRAGEGGTNNLGAVKNYFFWKRKKAASGRKISRKPPNNAGVGSSSPLKQEKYLFVCTWKSGHEKTQKPLWLLGFPVQYLFWLHTMVAGEGLEPTTSGLWVYKVNAWEALCCWVYSQLLTPPWLPFCKNKFNLSICLSMCFCERCV